MLSEQNQLALSLSLDERSIRVSAIRCTETSTMRDIAETLPEGEAIHALQLLCGETTTIPETCLGLPLLEWLLPDIRLVAMLSASQRCHFPDTGSRTPNRLSDDADWLAARIAVLGARYVQLLPEQLPLLTLANQRLQRLSQVTGCSLTGASAMLQLVESPSRKQTMLLWSAQDQDLIILHATMGNNALTLGQEMARRGRKRIAPLLQFFGAI